MDFDMFTGGGFKDGWTKSRIVLTVVCVCVSLLVVISLATLPGTIGHTTKYVEKNDPDKELKLSAIKIPVSLLSVTLISCVILTGICILAPTVVQ